MSRLSSFVDYWLRRIGWPLFAGGVLIVASIALCISLALPMQHRLQNLEMHVAKMRSGIAQREKSWVPESPQAAINTFYRFLPPENNTADALEKIFDAAFDSDLEVEKGEYKYVREHDAAFSRYQVTLPVLGSYENVRKFVNRVLKDVPSATLDDIGFSREDVRNPDVSATVRFTLYLGVRR